MANGAPRHRVSQSAMTSNLRLSDPLNSPKSKSRTNTSVSTRAAASLHTSAEVHSRAKPLQPRTPAWHTLPDGGQTRRVGSNIRRCAKRNVVGDGDVCTTGDGTDARQSWWPCWLGELSWRRRPEDHVATSTVPAQGQRGKATPLHLWVVLQHLDPRWDCQTFIN